MATRQELVASKDAGVESLEDYINQLTKQAENAENGAEKTRMYETIAKLTDQLTVMRSRQSSLRDQDPQLKSAIDKLDEVNAEIEKEIGAAKEFKDAVEQAAVILKLIQGAISVIV